MKTWAHSKILRRAYTEKFKLSTEPHVDVAIEEDMKQRYTRWRYTLHQMFLECKTVEQALANPLVEVDVDDWKYLVKLWQDESWKRNHETGVLPSYIDTLKLTRYDEDNKKWVDHDAKKAYGSDEMDRLRTNPPKELQHMYEDEIYDHVLGEAPSGNIRRLRAGPKPKPSSRVAERRYAQVEAATRRAEEAEAQSAKLAEELITVKNELVEMRSNFNQQLLDIQLRLGYCPEKEQVIHVYEYMQNGNLENHLFRKGGEPLAWDIRLKIAIDAARVFAFLHSLEDTSAIYCNFNISQILLDREYNAKLSDFELFKYEKINVEYAYKFENTCYTSPEGITLAGNIIFSLMFSYHDF
ncbi:hypothetical protein Dsin_001339 [Dipteronia sinensis]|uniref:Protein kinase domain-containing protein n=1 Tax=Dipteronia sinensis TaxID=43782 RepID=A0AAE0B4K7_9ROSI|nr:hypothetical protein Dsin_001339 [Dipteronia sinensis]